MRYYNVIIYYNIIIRLFGQHSVILIFWFNQFSDSINFLIQSTRAHDGSIMLWRIIYLFMTSRRENFYCHYFFPMTALHSCWANSFKRDRNKQTLNNFNMLLSSSQARQYNCH